MRGKPESRKKLAVTLTSATSTSTPRAPQQPALSATCTAGVVVVAVATLCTVLLRLGRPPYFAGKSTRGLDDARNTFSVRPRQCVQLGEFELCNRSLGLEKNDGHQCRFHGRVGARKTNRTVYFQYTPNRAPYSPNEGKGTPVRGVIVVSIYHESHGNNMAQIREFNVR